MVGQETVLLESVKVDSEVVRLSFAHVQKQALEDHELSVVRVIFPGRNLNSIPRLTDEIFFNVVNNDCF